MTQFEPYLQVVTLTSVFLVGYAYFGYPVLIWACSRLFGRRARPRNSDGNKADSVTLLIVAYNEERHIRERIDNALDTSREIKDFHLVIASDGSTDATESIVREYADRGVRLLSYTERRGKPAVLTDAMRVCTTRVVAFSDANTFFDSATLTNLLRWFSDPAVGAVCGRLALVDPVSGRNVDGMYWKYETFLKKCEARLDALLGANGAVYALRHNLYSPLPKGTIVDDFVIPLVAKIKTGCSIIYDDEAIAVEETPATIGAEFRRRSRIGAGGFQCIGALAPLLSPRFGWTWFSFISHKLLRWLCPFFLISAFVANAFLLQYPLFLALMFCQLGFYILSWVGNYVPGNRLPAKLIRLTTMFTTMNIAIFSGFIKWLGGWQQAAWQRTARTACDPS